MHRLKTNHNRKRGGFTLAEILIAVFITTLISAGISQSFILLSKNYFSIGNYVDLSAQSRKSLELFGRDMRMTATIYTANDTTIDVDIMTPSGAQNVVYAYDGDAKTFSRTTGGNTEVVLRNCDALTLDYFTITDASTTSLGSIKKVQLSAITRRWVQNLENTDHLITATYMMRNRNIAN